MRALDAYNKYMVHCDGVLGIHDATATLSEAGVYDIYNPLRKQRLSSRLVYSSVEMWKVGYARWQP